MSKLMDDQVPMWEPPARDQTPIVTGGAVLIARLTPSESAYLLTLAPTLHEAVHVLLLPLTEVPLSKQEVEAR